MIPIKKKAPPAILLEKQKIACERGLNAHGAYALLNHAEKRVVLESLMQEQGHLCAYCMRRIPDERERFEGIEPVTIEHWLPQNPHDHIERGQGLDYTNLLAVCSGNRTPRNKKHKPRDLTCDARRKGSYAQLTLNPCDADTLKSISYRENGEMDSTDPAVKDDIVVKLNLNCVSAGVQLPETRKRVLETLQSELPADDKEATLERCKEFLKMFEDEKDPKTEYVGILLWWLRDYIKNACNT